MNKSFRIAAAGIASLAFAGLASAQDVTGAGASFPAPLYAKWASDYNKATGVKINYQSVGSGAGAGHVLGGSQAGKSQAGDAGGGDTETLVHAVTSRGWSSTAVNSTDRP